MEICIFCNPQRDVKQNIVFENDTCYFLQHDNEQQILVGCGVVVPKTHHINVFELTKEEWNDTFEMKCFIRLRSTLVTFIHQMDIRLVGMLAKFPIKLFRIAIYI